MKNEVIVIGEDHINALGVIRALGEHGIKPLVIAISNYKKPSIVKSRYVKQSWICKKEEDAIAVLQYDIRANDRKTVIIPTSDKITSVLDKNLDRLKAKYIIGNINNQQNQINCLMDKYRQFLLFKECRVNCAESCIIDLEKPIMNIRKFPVIVKPIVSAEGDKIDIEICRDRDSLSKTLRELKLKQYKKTLVQEYIEFENEYEISGFIYKGRVFIPGMTKKVRIWPVNKGSTTFGEIMPIDGKIFDIISRVMKKINYEGIFDVEVFKKENDYFINEINFRNSGHSYAYRDHHPVYYWYISIANRKYEAPEQIKENYYFIDDQAELHQIIERNISIRKHLLDKRRSKVRLVGNKEDKKPSKKMFLIKILKKAKIDHFLGLLHKAIHKSDDAIVYKLEKIIQQTAFRKNKTEEIIEVSMDNIELFNGKKDENVELKSLLKKKTGHCIVLLVDGQLAAKGIIKTKGSSDRFAKIKNDSYLISNIFVEPKYRGNNYQCIVMQALIDKYALKKKASIYAIVYKKNIPSRRNVEKLGFHKISVFHILRLAKHSIGKIVI